MELKPLHSTLVGVAELVGPLPIGPNEIQVQAQGPSGEPVSTVETVDVVWVGVPAPADFPLAQHDPTNKNDPLPTSPRAPFRSWDALNNGYSVTRLEDGALRFEVRQGDKTGDSGGDRSGLTINAAYVPDIGAAGVAGMRSFYRLAFELPPENTLPLTEHNNFSEWHGKASGGSVLTIAPNGAGDRVGVRYQPFVDGVWGKTSWFGETKIVLGQLYDWTLDVFWSPEEDGGFTVYRDGAVVGVCQGPTMKSFADGTTEPSAFSMQLYRSPKVVPPSYMIVRKAGISRTLEGALAI